MNKRNKLKYLELFNPSDSIFILGFILGSIVAIFFNVFEIRVIGGSVSILAGLRILMIVKERSAFLPDTKRAPKEAPVFEVREISDNQAKRQVIEDFESKFEDVNEIKAKPLDEKLIEKFSFFGKNKSTPISNKIEEEEVKEFELDDPEAGVSIKIRPLKKKEETVSLISSSNEIQSEIQIKAEPIAEVDSIDEINYDEIINNNTEKYEEELFEEKIKTAQSIIEKPEKTKYVESEKIENFRPKQIDFDLSLLIEQDEDVNPGEPKKEFEYFIQRILQIIRSVTSTRTAAFLLINQERNEMVLVACVTDQPNAITKNKKLVIDNDIISQIIKNQKPEILSDINPSAELDLIPYYTKNVGTNSFIGVPVFYGNSITGIIAADTETNDAYDSITVGFLGHFTKLINSLMQSYTEKFELVLADKALNVANEFRNQLSGQNLDSSELFKLAISSITKALDYSTIGIIAYDDEYQKWMIKALTSKRQNESYTHFQVDEKNSIVANTIMNCKQNSCQIINSNLIRINESEPPIENGYFISVPIKSFKNNFGSLYLENINSSSINNNDILLLSQIADYMGVFLEQMIFNNFMAHQPMIENNTGIMNNVAFYNRLDEELSKSIDFNTPISLLIFKIDNYSAVNNQLFHTNYDPINLHVINIIQRFIKRYDVLGHIDESTFAITLIGMNLQNANNWARRLRSEIASSSLSLNNRRFTVTISGGLAEYKKNEDIETFIQNTKMVLEIASQKSNNIKTYS